jgi:hypothetical protein
MPWTIPDKGEGLNDAQSIMFQEYIDVLVEGMSNRNCILSGCTVTGGAGMTPTVNKGSAMSANILYAIPSATVTITTADATNPRIDLIVITTAGAKAVRAGTPATNPKPPARTADDVVIAAVWVPANNTTVAQTQITDLRVIRQKATLKFTNTPVTFNNNATIQTYFTVTLPSGLFLAGQQMRVTAGGSFLTNTSGLSVFTLTIAYGGTTLFADSTTTPTASAIRGAWYLDAVLNAQTNTAQQLAGHLSMGPPLTGGKVAAASGIGMLETPPTAYTNMGVAAPFRGSSAVDSDAGDRAFTIQWTQSVANAASEMSLDFGMAELL